ncbi:hypothetical protein Sjap_014300 [Stephania japonica]|uniref:ADP,ATP carrier protein n=1 Tax=Stephania japonica TaxID=461633 RepID=A0AAP0J1E4_9MAGN
MINNWFRVEAIVSSIVSVRPHEISALIHSSSCFFFILSAYFVVLPLRDEGAISLGLTNLPELFLGSLVLTLIAAPVSTLLFSLPHLSKDKVLASHLLKSKEGQKSAINQGSSASSASWGDHGLFYVSVRIGLFLWVALLNLITISSTWARVIDVMDNEVSNEYANRFSKNYRITGNFNFVTSLSQVQDYLGSLVPVLRLVSYLVHCLLQEWLGWDLKVNVIAMTISSSLERRRLFAEINSFIAVFILAGQLTITGRILTLAGVTTAMCLSPCVAFSNMIVIAVWPTWIVVAITEILRKMVTYVLTRPARELLFTVVSVDEKYKAKVCIDVIIQRLGDAAAAGIYKLLGSTLNGRMSTVPLYALPVCFLWLITAFNLGRRQAHLAKLQNSDTTNIRDIAMLNIIKKLDPGVNFRCPTWVSNRFIEGALNLWSTGTHMCVSYSHPYLFHLDDSEGVVSWNYRANRRAKRAKSTHCTGRTEGRVADCDGIYEGA